MGQQCYWYPISELLQQELPGLRGFSETSIKRMRIFYEAWCSMFENRPLSADDLLLSRDWHLIYFSVKNLHFSNAFPAKNLHCSNNPLDIYAVFVLKTWKFCVRDWQTDKSPMHKGLAVFFETVKTDRRLTAFMPNNSCIFARTSCRNEKFSREFWAYTADKRRIL